MHENQGAAVQGRVRLGSDAVSILHKYTALGVSGSG